MTAPIEAVRLLRSSCQAFASAVASRLVRGGAGGAPGEGAVDQLVGFQFGHGRFPRQI